MRLLLLPSPTLLFPQCFVSPNFTVPKNYTAHHLTSHHLFHLHHLSQLPIPPLVFPHHVTSPNFTKHNVTSHHLASHHPFLLHHLSHLTLPPVPLPSPSLLLSHLSSLRTPSNTPGRRSPVSTSSLQAHISTFLRCNVRLGAAGLVWPWTKLLILSSLP